MYNPMSNPEDKKRQEEIVDLLEEVFGEIAENECHGLEYDVTGSKRGYVFVMINRDTAPSSYSREWFGNKIDEVITDEDELDTVRLLIDSF